METDKYRCRICDYVYDPSLGDLENKHPPGTEYKQLPCNWTCPQCGASRGEFENCIGEE
jgi:rubredoxin